MWKLFFLKHLDFFETSKMPCQIHFYALFCRDVAGAEPEGGMAKRPKRCRNDESWCTMLPLFHSGKGQRNRMPLVLQRRWGNQRVGGGRFFLGGNVEIGMFFLQHASQFANLIEDCFGQDWMVCLAWKPLERVFNWHWEDTNGAWHVFSLVARQLLLSQVLI